MDMPPDGQLGSDTDIPGALQGRLTCGIHAMGGKGVHGKIDADGDNGHDFPFHKDQ